MYHIYTLIDPQTNNIRYVGMSQNAYKRYGGHLIIPSKNLTKKDLWVQEILSAGLAPTLCIIETLTTKEEAEQREGYWIHHYAQKDPTLLNVNKNTKAIPVPPPVMDSHTPISSEEELRQFLKERGWTLYKRTKGNREFYLALKWKQDQVYLTAASKLPELTKEAVQAKLDQKEKPA